MKVEPSRGGGSRRRDRSWPQGRHPLTSAIFFSRSNRCRYAMFDSACRARRKRAVSGEKRCRQQQ